MNDSTDRTDFSPFNASGGSWGLAPATQPHLVGEIRRLRECFCGAPSGNSGGTTLYFQSASVMRASTEYSTNRLAVMDYIDTEGGGGGGVFRFKTDSLLADDNADTFKPNAIGSGESGRWVRLPYI